MIMIFLLRVLGCSHHVDDVYKHPTPGEGGHDQDEVYDDEAVVDAQSTDLLSLFRVFMI